VTEIHLVAHLQDQDGSHIDLGLQGVTIGRDGTNDVVLELDMQVSRCHATIRLQDGQWVLVDLGSMNGTYVNNRPVKEHPLRNGDQLRFGGRSFTFLSSSDPLATEAAVPSPGAEQVIFDLTDREREVLQLVSEGLTDKEIGTNLHISFNTVRSHLDRIGGKTGLRKRSELTRLAIALNLGESS
jgi:pSer/pThr/pTyr-binding forkhead associated (FHA) protein